MSHRQKRGMVGIRGALIAFLALSGVSVAAAEAGEETGSLRVDKRGTIPESKLLSAETRAVLRKESAFSAAMASLEPACKSLGQNSTLTARIECAADAFYASPAYKDLSQRYPLQITANEIAGIYTENFLPADGVATKNRRRVLINVHGGAFLTGARWVGRVESMPIAALGGFKIISVDYRQGPDHRFPAASEDVVAVYRELLKTYRPKQIGIYGCSAGGLLTAQTTALLIKEGLPLPGAIGMFCNGATYWTEGDSGYFLSSNPPGPDENPYFKGVDINDPLAFPLRSDATLAEFPPSLLIAGTRDFALSSVVNTHSRLIANKIKADLHIWEGLGHGFFMDPALPESSEAYRTIISFFDAHLAK